MANKWYRRKEMYEKFVELLVDELQIEYTNNDGEDRARMNVVDFANIDDIRNGRYVLPDAVDNRKEKAADQAPIADGASIYDADIPFI